MKIRKFKKIIALIISISSIVPIIPNSLINANAAETGWIQGESYWHYMDATGRVATGWLKDNGYWYYFDSKGIMKTGWVYVDGNWYYFYSDGKMATETTIDGYYLNSGGAWTNSKPNNQSLETNTLTWKDVQGTHSIKDAAPMQVDYDAEKLVSYENIEINDDDNTLMKLLFYHLDHEVLSLPEAKYQCVGKTIGGKYLIKDIKYFQKDLQPAEFNCDHFNAQAIANFLKQSSIYNYKSTSPYVYDTGIAMLVGNVNTHWEIVRMVVEFEAV
ncbi:MULTISPECIES: N-acetylmuramoyl-L-alanine amidase family protein [unclassified Clostridium]|uniref:N-acetylmuramoyl-L-alanine amidase family protein n=1 Tax=unclassified Clostridium TaxID=2614128 RepID=UPI0002983615|nr:MULTISPECIES: N-acetylmuramoyl-L-alanine amidase family protein [unclassified Clostridium]EKQ56410.1 MAG: putative cell wall binding protein [Clostridium sp. Maddingley MBC34-26]